MTKTDLIKLAASGYPDEFILEYWNEDDEDIDGCASGDTLAKFIAIELMETMDVELDDVDQLEVAIYKLRNARDDLDGVIQVLENEQVVLKNRRSK